MRQILSRSLLTVAAAGSVLAVGGGYASADSGAEGSAAGSPGVLSGNSIQAPIDVPVNACGNTVNAVGAGNAAFGNHCANISEGDGPGAGAGHDAGASAHDSGAYASGSAEGSPGLLSGNNIKIPVHAPVNACGNSVDPLALLNPSFGNSCENGSTVDEPGPPPPSALPPEADTSLPPVPAPRMEPQLAETGITGRQMGTAGATSAALLLGGAMLYRRGVRPAHARRTTAW